MIVTNDRIAATALIIFGGGAYWVAQSTLPSKAGAMPSTVAILIVVLASMLLLRPTKLNEDGEVRLAFAASWPRLLKAIALTLLYFVVTVPFGFVTSTILFIVVTAFLSGYRNAKFLIGVAIAFAVFSRLIFGSVLGLRLPEDWIINAVAGVLS
jgi:hypothetical protein